jgi:hypothetical protein
MKEINDYTHKLKKIEDIRLKRGAKQKDEFFAIKIEDVEEVVYVNYNIFNDRVRAYFLGKAVKDVSRGDITGLHWNFIITKGHYLKIVERGKFEEIQGVPGKTYVSVLEISGAIGDFKNNFGNQVEVVEFGNRKQVGSESHLVHTSHKIPR